MPPRRVSRRGQAPPIAGLDDIAIIGIDPSSTKLAAITFTARGFSAHEWTLAKRSGAEACGRAYAATERLADQDAVRGCSLKLAFIEHPLVGRGGIKTTMVQAFTSGSMQAALHNAGFRVTLVHQASWKAKVIGSGRADKDEVARSVRQRWPTIHEACQGSQDLIDATAIAIYGGRVTVGPEFLAGRSPLQRLVASIL